MEFTIEMQNKALDYTLIFLQDEISKIKNSIKICKHEPSKNLLEKRLKELEKDLNDFEQLVSKWR